VPIPKTFSAPADETFPALNGYAPTIEDSTRYAVWLMMYADDVNRKSYSFDDDDPAKGVRIRQNRADADPVTGQLVLPQQLIGVRFDASRFTYETGMSGEETVEIACMHLEAVDSSWLDTDVDNPPLTLEARCGRWREILMRGTIFEEAQLQKETYALVDPFYSPLDENGFYDTSQMVTLTTKPPAVRPTARSVFPARPVKSEAELWKLDPVKDFAVAYGVLATFQIPVRDRRNMRRGG
jgi:hypothetical protein